MSAVMAAVENYADMFRPWLERRGREEPAWLGDVRQHALDDFLRLGFPSQKDEAWRYTRLTGFDQQRFQPAPSSEVAFDKASILGISGGARLVFVDGHFDHGLSNMDGLPAGVSLSSWRQFPELINHDWAVPVSDGMRALNQVLMNDGAHICIAPEVVVDQPIELIHLATGKGAHYLHHFIEVGRGASVRLLDRFAGQGAGEYFTSNTSQLMIGQGAKVTHYKIQQELPLALHYSVLGVEQQQGSQFDSFVLALGARVSRHEIDQGFVGPDSACRLDGLFLVTGAQHADLQTRIDHNAPCCVSREFYRGVADQRGRGVFNGQIIVSQGAQQTDARLSTNNLLLSPLAEINCKPQLEIYADDVKCGHGATIGQLDEDALFYLRSRGLDQEGARNLLVFAFVNEVLDHVVDKEIQDYCLHRVLDRLSSGLAVKEMIGNEILRKKEF